MKKTVFEKGNWTVVVNELAKGSPQCEIRNGKGVVIVVSLGDGYIYNHYGRHRYWLTDKDPLDETRGINVHLAISGPLQCTFEEWDEIHDLVDMARAILEQLEHNRLIWEGDPDKVDAFPGLNEIMEDLGV